MFTDIAAAAGVDLTGGDGGVTLVDYDADGAVDVFAITAAPNPPLLRNAGGASFTDVSGAVGISTGGGALSGVSWADFDADGYLDLYVGRGGGNKLFASDGDGTFTESAAAAGVADGGSARAVTWVDYDGDEWIDLFVVNDGSEDRLFHNNSDGTFTETGAAAGVADVQAGRGAAWADYDGDDDPDLYLVVDGGANRLYRNDGGVFAEVAASAGVDEPGAAAGIAWGDYDNDGELDLFLARDGANRLYHNTGGGTFTEVGAAAGVDDAGSARGVAWGDYDNDGHLDLFVGNDGSANLLYRNEADGSFTDVAGAEGVADAGSAAGAAWGDIDGDGFIDLYVVNEGGTNRLYQNAGNGNHWIVLDLTGEGGRPAPIGTSVTIVAGGLRQTRHVDGGSGYASQPSLALEFGLGAAASIDTLQVTWASGTEQVLTDVQPDEMPVLEEVSVVESTPAAVLAAAVEGTPGDEIQVFSLGLTTAGSATLSSIDLILSDLTAATGLVAADVESVRLYRSTDAALDGGDALLGTASDAAIAVGTPITVAPASAETLPQGEIFYLLSLQLAAGAGDAHAIKVAFPAGGVATSAGVVGTATAGSDADRILVAVDAGGDDGGDAGGDDGGDAGGDDGGDAGGDDGGDAGGDDGGDAGGDDGGDAGGDDGGDAGGDDGGDAGGDDGGDAGGDDGGDAGGDDGGDAGGDDGGDAGGDDGGDAGGDDGGDAGGDDGGDAGGDDGGDAGGDDGGDAGGDDGGDAGGDDGGDAGGDDGGDAGEGAQRVAAPPQRGWAGLEIAADTLDFGLVQLDGTARRSCWLHNPGTAALYVSAVHSSNAAYRAQWRSQRIEPGASRELSFDYRPRTTRLDTATVTIVSTAGSLRYVNLTGRGVQPAQLSVDAAPLDFDIVLLDSLRVHTVTVANTGGDTLHLSAAAEGSDFSAAPSRADVLPGDSLAIRISFDASAAGITTGQLHLSGASQTTQIPLAAEAIDPRERFDMTGDKRVNCDDLQSLLSALNGTPSTAPTDLNRDGVLDEADLDLLLPSLEHPVQRLVTDAAGRADLSAFAQSATLAQPPQHGYVSPQGASLIYTAPRGFDAYELIRFVPSVDGEVDCLPLLLRVRSMTNRAPVLAAVPDTTVVEGDSLRLSLAVDDPDGDRVTVSVLGLQGATVVDGRLVWKAAMGSAGDERRVYLRARDVYGGTSYRFFAITVVESGATKAVAAGANQAPGLAPNYPNPFNGQTTIRYELPRAMALRVAVYDVLGRRVRTLYEGEQSAGGHNLPWDGRDDNGRRLAAGVYLQAIEGPQLHEVRKMTLLP